MLEYVKRSVESVNIYQKAFNAEILERFLEKGISFYKMKKV